MSLRLPSCIYVCVYMCLCVCVSAQLNTTIIPTFHSCCRKRHNLLFCQCEWAEIAVFAADLRPSPPPPPQPPEPAASTLKDCNYIHRYMYNICLHYIFSLFTYSYCTSVPMGVVMSWRQWPWIKCWYARAHTPSMRCRTSWKRHSHMYVLASAARAN